MEERLARISSERAVRKAIFDEVQELVGVEIWECFYAYNAVATCAFLRSYSV
jgi:hypothetical protein